VKNQINIIRFTYISGPVYSQHPLSKRKFNSHKLIGIAMTHYSGNYSHNITANPAGFYESLLQLVRQWMNNLRLKSRIQRERATLVTMSNAHLKDIGIDRMAAEREALRNDIPQNRGL
jgi:uncharacterized protein YjiS (DUF1127 family)